MTTNLSRLLLAAPLLACVPAIAQPKAPPRAATPGALTADLPYGHLEVVHRFTKQMPTGVTVSQSGRVFVNYPRWGDKVAYTVAEIVNGREVPFPNRAVQAPAPMNRIVQVATKTGSPALLASRLVSVQSVVVDPLDRLWILDTGSPLFLPSRLGGPKMVCVDLKTNRVTRTIVMPRAVAGPTSYLNDVRFDLRAGRNYAFITDSSGPGPNAIIVVNLATGEAFRRLNNHPTTRPEPTILPFVEGHQMMERRPGQKPKPIAFGADGIAISPNGKRLYYCPVATRRLYSVSTDALVNRSLTDAQVAQTIVYGREKGITDGLESDTQDRVYLTLPEAQSIGRRYPNALVETLVHDPRILWPDTMSLAGNGDLYFTSNQLHRQPNFNAGRDYRRKPYVLFRVRTDGKPVRLK